MRLQVGKSYRLVVKNYEDSHEILIPKAKLINFSVYGSIMPSDYWFEHGKLTTRLQDKNIVSIEEVSSSFWK